MNGLNRLICASVAFCLVAPSAYAKHGDDRHDGGGHDKAFNGSAHIPPGLAKKPHGLPPGQAKKLWGRGERLPHNYVVETRYVVVQPQRYRLPTAPAGYRWVGVDGDAYLVQTQSGLISQVIQSFLR